MKKLLIILLIVSPGIVSGQSKLSELSEDATVDGSDWIYDIQSGTSYKMSMQTLMNFIGASKDSIQDNLEDSCSDLRTAINDISAGEYWSMRARLYDGTLYRIVYPTDGVNYMNLRLGSSPPIGVDKAENQYRLYCDGQSYFNDTTFMPALKFNSASFIYDSISTIWFRDGSQKYSLSELTNLPSTLSTNWDLATSTHDIHIQDGDGNGYFWDYSTGILKLTADGYIDFEAPYSTHDSVFSTDIAAVNSHFDYITLNDERIDDWDDVGGSGGTLGTYVDGSSSGIDTVWMPVVVNIAGPTGTSTDSSDYIAVINDPTVDQIYLQTISLSSANILAGDSIQILAAPGTGIAYIPIKAAFFFDYGTATYASMATTYIRTGVYGSEVNIGILSNTMFHNTADRLYHSTEDDTNIFEIQGGTDTDLGVNQSIWIDLGDNAVTGDGTGVLKFWYTKADFN